jgi:hypothetical protein
VLISGCHPGDCHYLDQNYKALRRYKLLRRTLEQMGIEPERVKLVWASAAEGIRLAREITKMVEEVRLSVRSTGQKRGRIYRWSFRRKSKRGLPLKSDGGRSMSENGKPKFAMYWAASCGGCEIAVLNIHEKILDVDANFDVVFWPVAMDAKYKDVEAMPDKSITLTLFNGGIRNEENEHLAKLMRQKSQILVAFGSCASEGCIPGLANLSKRRIFSIRSTRRSRRRTPGPRSALSSTMTCPGRRAEHPGLLHATEDAGSGRGRGLLHARLPAGITSDRRSRRFGHPGPAGRGRAAAPGSVIGAGMSTVCDECGRTRNVKKITAFSRPGAKDD